MCRDANGMVGREPLTSRPVVWTTEVGIPWMQSPGVYVKDYWIQPLDRLGLVWHRRFSSPKGAGDFRGFGESLPFTNPLQSPTFPPIPSPNKPFHIKLLFGRWKISPAFSLQKYPYPLSASRIKKWFLSHQQQQQHTNSLASSSQQRNKKNVVWQIITAK